jgi:hypothetical protein
MKPIRTYAVTVKGYGEALYSARSPGKALARSFKAFGSVSDGPFGEFMKIATARRVKDPPGCGERIVIGGETVTRVAPPYRDHQAIFYMRDDSDDVLCSHPSDVAGVAA